MKIWQSLAFGGLLTQLGFAVIREADPNGNRISHDDRVRAEHQQQDTPLRHLQSAIQLSEVDVQEEESNNNDVGNSRPHYSFLFGRKTAEEKEAQRLKKEKKALRKRIKEQEKIARRRQKIEELQGQLE